MHYVCVVGGRTLEAFASFVRSSVVAILAMAISLCATQASAQVRYNYDELGRLVQVVAPDGQSALYNYDAVGNILSISKLGSTTISIGEFSPNSGPVGASVVIYGTGFSSAPSENIVTFNNTTATVASATANRLSVTVPTGATTGRIAVTVGGATATSLQDFTVSAAPPPPTISGFSPTIGTPGTPVTVSGTNFDANAANNKVRFSGTTATALISSAALTQLGTKVPPNAASGRLSVATPNGAAVSTSDFFVPPAGYTSANVGFTGRTGLGTTNLSLATAKIGMLLFDGVQGQKLGLAITNIAYSPSGGSATIYVKKPNGEDLMTAVGIQSTTTGFSLPTLPTTGTYMIVIVPNAAYGVSMDVRLFEDVVGTMTPGLSLAVATTYPGQQTNIGFSGTQGQQVSLRISGITITGGISLSLSILKPDGSTLATLGWVSGNSFIDVQTLPVTGTYTIVMDPAGTATASATLTLYHVVDASGSIQAGAPISAVVSTPGQSVNLSAAGVQGQRFAVGMSAVALTGGNPNSDIVSLLQPDGSTLATLSNGTSNSFIEPQSLPTTGTYTVRFHPINGSTGTATFTLYDVPPDATGTITAGGPSVQAANTVAGQNANLTFSGTAGQRISLTVPNLVLTGQTPAYFNSAIFSILKPDATTLASVHSNTSFINTQTLPVSGTYTVRFDPSSFSVGTATLALHDVPPNPTSSVEIGGTSTTVSIAVPGQNANVTFSGVAGQQVTVRATRTFGDKIFVTLQKPDNSTLTWTQTWATSFNLATQTLPTTGTYNIFIDPVWGATGNLTIGVTSP